MKKWLLATLLLSVLAWGQSSNVPDQNTAFWGATLNGVPGNASGAVVNYADTRGTITNQFEIVAQGTAAATLTTTIVGCMRGGTCSSTLASSSGVSSQIIAAASSSLNVFDFYKITLSWTGGDATTRFIVNRTGTVARLPGSGSGSGTVSANNGSAGAMALYAAAGGSTTVSPDANVNDNGTTFAVNEAMTQGTAGQTSFAAGGGLSKYKGTSTGGNGLAFVLGTPSNVTAQTASQATVQLVTSTPSAGQYEIQGYVDERVACATVSGSQVLVNLNWTDATLARQKVITLTFDTTTAAGSFQAFNVPIFAANASSINYTTTYTACATGGPASYDLHAAVIQLQ